MKTFLAASVLILVMMVLAGCGGSSSPAPNPTPVPPSPSPSPAAVVITSTPPASAQQGQTYTYTIVAVGPAGVTVNLQLTAAPAGASLAGNILTWVPSGSQARSQNSFTVTASIASGAATAQFWTITPSGVVQGTKVVNHVTDSGGIPVPEDTTLTPVVAMVPSGSDYNTTVANGSTSGAFLFPNIPAGYFWLQGGPQTYIWTSSSLVDLGSDALGRPDSLPSEPMQLRFNLTGLNPWQTADRQQLFVSNNGTSMVRDWSSWGVINGATTIDQTVDWTDPVLDSTEEDSAYVTQLVTTPTTLGGPSVLVLKKTLGPEEIEATDTGQLLIQGALSDVSLDHSLRANIIGSAFAQLEAGMNPAAVADSTYFYVDAHPGGLAKGWIGATPDLVLFDGTNAPIHNDVDYGAIAFGSPFPASWGTFFDYIHYVHVNYTAPGATNPTTQFAALELQTTALPTLATPVRPAVGPVQNATINGANFFSNQTITNTMPTLAWNPPALGLATGYTIEIFHLYSNDTDSLSEPVVTLYTKTSSIQVPPGLLLTGNSYFFRISAVYEIGVDYETAPFRHAFPRAIAQSLSGVITL